MSGPAGRLTGERPKEGVTPDSLLALHAAGYRTVIERLGPGPMLDVGCGEGFESARFLAADRTVVGADYSAEAVGAAAGRWGPEGLRVAQMNALALGLAAGASVWACSSHLIEHFDDPEGHVRELARVLADDGTVFFLTPNAPADFENPFHIHLFEPPELRRLLEPALPPGHRAGPRRRAPRQGRLHRPPGQGRQGARASTSSTFGTGSRGRGTSPPTPGSCPWPTR